MCLIEAVKLYLTTFIKQLKVLVISYFKLVFYFAGFDQNNILLTCSKGAWYKKKRRAAIDETRPGAFAKDSRLFGKVNWIPNTTRGINVSFPL